MKTRFLLPVVLLAIAPVLVQALPPTPFHLGLKRSEPGANDTLSVSPPAVKLWFTQSVQAGSTSIRLTASDNRVIRTGPVTVAAAALSPAVAKVSETLRAGRYTLAWKTMSADGHPTSGKFTFTVRAAK